MRRLPQSWLWVALTILALSACQARRIDLTGLEASDAEQLINTSSDIGDGEVYVPPPVDPTPMPPPAPPATGPRCYAEFILADNPVGYWRFNDTGAVAEDSGPNALDGDYKRQSALVQGYTLGQTGALPNDSDKAVRLNGGVVDLSDLTPLGVSSGSRVTAEFWMKWEGAQKTIPISLQGGMSMYFFTSGLSSSFGFNTGTNDDVYGIPSSGMANNWIYVVAEFVDSASSSAFKLYINGTVKSLTQRNGTFTPRDFNSAVMLGGWANDTGYRFTGSFDELAIYNGALTQTQINTHYAARNYAGCP